MLLDTSVISVCPDIGISILYVTRLSNDSGKGCYIGL